MSDTSDEGSSAGTWLAIVTGAVLAIGLVVAIVIVVRQKEKIKSLEDELNQQKTQLALVEDGRISAMRAGASIIRHRDGNSVLLSFVLSSDMYLGLDPTGKITMKAKAEATRFRFVVGPRVANHQHGRCAIAAAGNASALNWDADRFLVVDKNTKIMTTVVGCPTDACASWVLTCTNINRTNAVVQLWSDCFESSPHKYTPPTMMMVFDGNTNGFGVFENTNPTMRTPDGKYGDWLVS